MSNTLSLFTSPDLLPLAERIASQQFRLHRKHIPATDDRWMLASNLQKSIRRGLVNTAVGTATRLLEVDSRYFWRRLLVIAYEDVGYGDIGLCHTLLKTFRREALHRELGPENVARYFARELARARKNRSLCDAVAGLEFSTRRSDCERPYFRMGDEQLLFAACNAGAPVLYRVAALRHVCGYRQFAQGTYRTLAPARPDLMREVCRRLGLSEVETALFLSGQGVSEGMNITLPLIAQMVRGNQAEQQAEQALAGKHGILYAALDRHTRVGKRCFARLARECKIVRQFFDRRPALDPVAVLGAGVFVVEGAVLDRQLVFDGADDLQRQFDQNFLEFAGVAPDDQPELLALVIDSLPRLNRLRAEEIG